MKLRFETLIFKYRKWKRKFEYENEKESEFKPNLNKIKPNQKMLSVFEWRGGIKLKKRNLKYLIVSRST